MIWLRQHPQANAEAHLGIIPEYFDENDPKPAAQQVSEKYIGGWLPMKANYKFLPDGSFVYPGDPPTRLLYVAQFRNEQIRVYEHAWVGIFQPDGSFEISRMD